MVFGVWPPTQHSALSEMNPEYRLYKHSSAPLPFARPLHIFLGPYMAAGGRGCVLETQHLAPDSDLHETQVIIQPENTSNAQTILSFRIDVPEGCKLQEGVNIIPVA